ncbi:MAG: short-chain dehydrogenase/reductase, partial [Nitrospira sp.]|nr:short-chain dehydrogenase/reductase [Nitrospira sp.]
EAATTPELRRLYADVIAGVRKVVEEAAKRAIASDAVAQVVEQALTAARPKTRYLVGADAKFRAVMVKLLPDRVSDTVLSWVLKLPR